MSDDQNKPKLGLGGMAKNLFTSLGGGSVSSDDKESGAIQDLINVLKEGGMADDEAGLFLLLIHPLIARYVEVAIIDAIPEDELLAIQIVAHEQKLTDDDRNELVYELYKDKTKREMTEVVDEYIVKITENLKKAKQDLATLWAEIKDLPEDQQKQKAEEFMAMQI